MHWCANGLKFLWCGVFTVTAVILNLYFGGQQISVVVWNTVFAEFLGLFCCNGLNEEWQIHFCCENFAFFVMFFLPSVLIHWVLLVTWELFCFSFFFSHMLTQFKFLLLLSPQSSVCKSKFFFVWCTQKINSFFCFITKIEAMKEKKWKEKKWNVLKKWHELKKFFF